jgi:hypothetical protein
MHNKQQDILYYILATPVWARPWPSRWICKLSHTSGCGKRFTVLGSEWNWFWQLQGNGYQLGVKIQFACVHIRGMIIKLAWRCETNAGHGNLKNYFTLDPEFP